MGRPEAETCPDCGQDVPKRLEVAGTWLKVWVAEPHACPVREARQAEAAERRDTERRAWLENPPAERIEAVKRDVNLPWWTPAGVYALHRDKVPAAVLDAVMRHRDTWLSGRRPERGLWFYGPTNRRKTCALVALLFDLAHRSGRKVQAWNVEDLMGQLRRAAQGKGHRYDADRVETAPALLIDDLGTINPTPAAWRVLAGLAENAYSAWGAGQRQQVLYVTSNEPPAELVELLNIEGRTNGGERIVRRLAQLCEVIEVR